MERILLICMAVLMTACLGACSHKLGGSAADQLVVSEDVADVEVQGARDLEDPEASDDQAGQLAPEGRRHTITGSTIEEDLFLESLDTGVLEVIAGEIQSLVAQIQEREKTDPEYVLLGKWNREFRESEQYATVLNLGLTAVKPAYYVITKSNHAGLYEYMLASAIDDITGYDYSVTRDFQRGYLQRVSANVQRKGDAGAGVIQRDNGESGPE